MGSQLRVAIALAALRHKPVEQSIQAYILDLQAAFPVVCTCHCRPYQSGSGSSEPWRERALALESELERLRTQHEEEKIKLLASRKAAQPSKRPPRHMADDGRETDSTPSTTGKKAKAKKSKPSSAVATPPAPVPALMPLPTPAPGPKSVLSAILQGGFADPPARLAGSSPRISSALDAADALVELLAADPMAVSVDLVLSTTLRALEAANAVFSRIVARYESCSVAEPAGPGPGSSSGSRSGSAACLAWDPASMLEALTALVRSLVSTVVPALLAQRSEAMERINKPNVSLKRARTARITARAAVTAVDDILGGLYELLLAPAVRAFSLLSEGYLLACFADGSAPHVEATASADAPISVPDLRPEVFALLEGLLAILDDVLPANEPTTFAQARSPAGTAAAPAGPAPIPGPGELRTLLALECVRALDTLYGPHCHGQQHASGPPPDSPAQAYPHSAAPSLPSSAPARTSAASSGPLAARQGTAPAGFPLAGRAPPRAARNLGETALGAEPSGPQCGPVHDSVRAGAVASGSDGKAKEGGREGAAADAGERVRGARARIAGLARKDAVWWLCAVLGRLLPALSPPSAGAAGESDHGADGGSIPPLVACADVAHEAVYAALADLLRRTRPCPLARPRSGSGSGPAGIAARRGCSSPIPRPAPSPSPSPRRLSSCASNHEGGTPPEPPAASDDPVDAGTGLGLGAGRKSKRTLEKTNTGTHAEGPGEEDRRAGWAGAGAGMGMGEVERGMLLAVLERAWLGF